MSYKATETLTVCHSLGYNLLSTAVQMWRRGAGGGGLLPNGRGRERAACKTQAHSWTHSRQLTVTCSSCSMRRIMSCRVSQVVQHSAGDTKFNNAPAQPCRPLQGARAARSLKLYLSATPWGAICNVAAGRGRGRGAPKREGEGERSLSSGQLTISCSSCSMRRVVSRRLSQVANKRNTCISTSCPEWTMAEWCSQT